MSLLAQDRRGLLTVVALGTALVMFAGIDIIRHSLEIEVGDADSLVRDTVGPHGTNVSVIRLTGLRQTRILLHAERRLQCRIYDPDGTRVDSEDACLHAWLPQRTGPYRVEIRNPHGRRTSYTLSHSVEAR